MEKRKEIIVSIDIEADGPIPGIYSMLSLGAAAFSETGELLGTFQVNLQPLPDAITDPDTDRWWSEQSRAVYDAARIDALPAQEAMQKFVEWVKSFPNTSPVLTSYPGLFDQMFVWWNLVRFCGTTGPDNPFSFSGIDIKTLAWSKLGGQYRAAGKRAFPSDWFPEDSPHTHIAVDDALEQGYILFNIMKSNDGERK